MNQRKHPKSRQRSTVIITPEVAAVRHAASIPSFDELPDSALVRQSQLVRDSKHPTRPVPLPFSPATFWRKMAIGEFLTPIKLGERITAFSVGEVRQWIKSQSAALTEPVERAADDCTPTTSEIKKPPEAPTAKQTKQIPPPNRTRLKQAKRSTRSEAASAAHGDALPQAQATTPLGS